MFIPASTARIRTSPANWIPGTRIRITTSTIMRMRLSNTMTTMNTTMITTSMGTKATARERPAATAIMMMMTTRRGQKNSVAR